MKKGYFNSLKGTGIVLIIFALSIAIFFFVRKEGFTTIGGFEDLKLMTFAPDGTPDLHWLKKIRFKENDEAIEDLKQRVAKLEARPVVSSSLPLRKRRPIFKPF